MSEKLTLSPLGHTWIIDLDGTIVRHNGYIIDGYDTLLDGALEFLRTIPDDDMIVFLTSRGGELRDMTEGFLAEHSIRYDHIIFDAPYGERIIINDRKPTGLGTAVAVNVERDSPRKIQIEIDREL